MLVGDLDKIMLHIAKLFKSFVLNLLRIHRDKLVDRLDDREAAVLVYTFVLILKVHLQVFNLQRVVN